MQRRRVVVRGRVQGVGFRWSATDEADRLGLAGWVENRDDGTVEAVVEGEESAVEAMLAWLRHGPRTARVTGVDVQEEQPEGLHGFGVRR
jgi:acylphosphatase